MEVRPTTAGMPELLGFDGSVDDLVGLLIVLLFELELLEKWFAGGSPKRGNSN